MMIGHVQDLHALLPVTFRLSGHPNLIIEFVVDTGFTGFLTLPLAAVTALGSPHIADQSSRLADDSQIILPVHLATILWKGMEIKARVLATGRRPLLGTALLAGSDFRSQFVDSGIVTVDDV